jgi:hypothetical protein
MLTLDQFLTENYQFLAEAKDGSKPGEKQHKGTLHELLVGYHLGGGKHMQQHPKHIGETPQQVHDRLVKTFFKGGTSHTEYKEIYHKAKVAAENIEKHVGKKIKTVHWTSKNGDIGRVTGVDKDQKEDPSDLYIEHHTKPTGNKEVDHRARYTGVSLKTVLEKGGRAPGASQTAKEIDLQPSKHWAAAREEFYKKHPEFRGKHRDVVSQAIKDSKEGDRKLFNSESEIRTRALHKIAKDHAAIFQKMSKQDLAKYTRTLMRAHDTGHEHLRVTSGGTGADSTHHIEHPTTDHEHILNDHENISVRAEGHTVHFLHNGKSFYGHRLKADGGAGVVKGFGVIGNRTRK